MEKTKEISFDIDGVQHKVNLKRLTFGEKNKVEDSATEVKMMGNQPLVSVKTSVLKEMSLLKSVVSSTISLKTIEEIRDLPQEIGDMLYIEFNELNSVTEKKNE